MIATRAALAVARAAPAPTRLVAAAATRTPALAASAGRAAARRSVAAVPVAGTVEISRFGGAAPARWVHSSPVVGCASSGDGADASGGGGDGKGGPHERQWHHTSFIRGLDDDPQSPAIKRIFANNRKWVEGVHTSDPGFFERTSKGQSPRYLFIGCADSRVTANLITGLEQGDMFVTRNVANLVVGTDMSMLSVLQYAVEVLKVEEIIVCGHYECGGVKQAMKAEDAGLLENWLRNIRDVYRLHKAELDSIGEEAARFRRLVELNVGEQCMNVFKTGIVQRAQRERGGPRIHGLVYDIGDGLLRKVRINFKEYARQHAHIFSLYELPSDHPDSPSDDKSA